MLPPKPVFSFGLTVTLQGRHHAHPPLPHEETDLKIAGLEQSIEVTSSGAGVAGKKVKGGQPVCKGFTTSGESHEVNPS